MTLVMAIHDVAEVLFRETISPHGRVLSRTLPGFSTMFLSSPLMK